MNKDFEQAFIDDWNAGNVRNVATGELVVPKRKWVGLTDEDKREFVSQDFGGNRLDAMDWAEKRLKEKNHGA